jgi:hypothetical protein
MGINYFLKEWPFFWIFPISHHLSKHISHISHALSLSLSQATTTVTQATWYGLNRRM